MDSRRIDELLSLLREIFRTLGAYVRGQATVALIMAGLYAIGFALLKVPFWPLAALLCGFLNMVPFGTAVGMLLAMGASWAAGREFWQIAGVAIVVALVSGFESYFLTPRILGRELALRPLVIFLALLAGGTLFGPLGLLLAAPAVAVFNVVWKFSKRAKT